METPRVKARKGCTGIQGRSHKRDSCILYSFDQLTFWLIFAHSPLPRWRRTSPTLSSTGLARGREAVQRKPLRGPFCGLGGTSSLVWYYINFTHGGGTPETLVPSRVVKPRTRKKKSASRRGRLQKAQLIAKGRELLRLPEEGIQRMFAGHG